MKPHKTNNKKRGKERNGSNMADQACICVLVDTVAKTSTGGGCPNRIVPARAFHAPQRWGGGLLPAVHEVRELLRVRHHQLREVLDVDAEHLPEQGCAAE